jgi:sugar/nucleoside kinase (ribokinase family)
VQLSGYGLVLPGNGPLLSGLAAELPAGTTLCFDPGPLVADNSESVLDAVLARADWLSANAREARIMTGHEDPRTAAAALGERLAPGAGVLVRADKDGCWLAAPGQPPSTYRGSRSRRSTATASATPMSARSSPSSARATTR